MGIGSSRVTEDLGQDRGATGPGPFELFDNQYPGGLGCNKAVAASIKWSALARAGQSCHVLKTSESHNGGGAFGTAGDHGIASIPSDHVERVANTLIARGARRHRGLARTLEAILHGNMSR